MDKEQADPGGVAAVNRALSVLQAFENSVDGMTLTDLMNATGLYHSTILRLCESLEHFKYLKRLPDGRYMLGPDAVLPGHAVPGSFRLQDYALPVLRELSKATLRNGGDLRARRQRPRLPASRGAAAQRAHERARGRPRRARQGRGRQGAARVLGRAGRGVRRGARRALCGVAGRARLRKRRHRLPGVRRRPAAGLRALAGRAAVSLQQGQDGRRAAAGDGQPARRLTDDLGGDSSPLRAAARQAEGSAAAALEPAPLTRRLVQARVACAAWRSSTRRARSTIGSSTILPSSSKAPRPACAWRALSSTMRCAAAASSRADAVLLVDDRHLRRMDAGRRLEAELARAAHHRADRPLCRRC